MYCATILGPQGLLGPSRQLSDADGDNLDLGPFSPFFKKGRKKDGRKG